MTRRDWKRFRPNSLLAALRGCKEFALERKRLSIERIADLMGVTHDSLYKWLATGRMPLVLLPTYELACGCNFASVWLAAQAGKMVIDIPTGRHTAETDLVALNSGFSAALPPNRSRRSTWALPRVGPSRRSPLRPSCRS